MQRRTNIRGFTLIELLVTLLVAGIVIGLAAPSFSTLMQDNRMRTNGNELLTALALARSEAAKRYGVVSVCASVDGATCSGSDAWQQGWLIFAEPTPPTGDPDDGEIVQVRDALGGRITVTGPAGLVSYNARGEAAASTAFVLCDSRGTPQARTLRVQASGRARIEAGGTCS